MAYAQRLVDVRYDGEPDRQQKILTRLQKASTQEATARLMGSPLQITINGALVDQLGILLRSMAFCSTTIMKSFIIGTGAPDPAAELLREYKPNIDAIHHQVDSFYR